MVRYKCVKEYPGSPKLGTEVNYSEKHKIYNYNGGNFYTELPKHQVENLPEFWEEIKENEFLILSVSATKENTLYKVGHVDKITNTKSYTKCILEDSMSLGYWEIHSVQRLSDGEIFKLGDAVARGRDWKGWKNPACIIRSFKVRNREIEVEIQQEEDSSNYPLGGFYHVKEPLFTTEDGVDKYLGDNCYVIPLSSWTIGNGTITSAAFSAAKARFHSKDAAEKWVDENKPKYSIKDIQDIVVFFEVTPLGLGELKYKDLSIFIEELLKRKYDKT